MTAIALDPLIDEAKRRMRRRRLLGAAALVALAGAALTIALRPFAQTPRGATSANQAQTHVSPVIGPDRVAGLPVAPSSPSYANAQRFFRRHGERASFSRAHGFCYLTVPTLKLTMTFAPLTSDKATPASCRFFDAQVTVARWHTANGLHVGATLASLHRLFPAARSSGRIGGLLGASLHHPMAWLLANRGGPSPAARPVLVAYTLSGRVVALGILISGH